MTLLQLQSRGLRLRYLTPIDDCCLRCLETFKELIKELLSFEAIAEE